MYMPNYFQTSEEQSGGNFEGGVIWEYLEDFEIWAAHFERFKESYDGRFGVWFKLFN